MSAISNAMSMAVYYLYEKKIALYIIIGVCIMILYMVFKG